MAPRGPSDVKIRADGFFKLILAAALL